MSETFSVAVNEQPRPDQGRAAVTAQPGFPRAAGDGQQSVREEVAELGEAEAPRLIIQTEGHVIELSAFDLLFVSTLLLLATDTVVTVAEVFN